MWTPSQVNLKFRLNFWNYQPSCLPSSPHRARVTRYEAVRPWSLVWPYVLPVPDCLRVAAPSLSLLGWSPASSLPPHSTPCRYNNPAPWCSQSHPRTPADQGSVAIYSPLQHISLPCSICCSCHPLNTGPHLHLWSKFIKESPLRPIIGILWSIPWLPGAGALLPLRPSYEVVSSAGGCRGRFVFDFWTLLFS